MADVYKVRKWHLNNRATNTTSVDTLLFDLQAKEYCVFRKTIHQGSLSESTVDLIKLKNNLGESSHFKIHRHIGNGLYVIASQGSQGEQSGGIPLGMLYIFIYKDVNYELFFNWQEEKVYLIAYSNTSPISDEILELFAVDQELTLLPSQRHLIPFSWI